MKKCPFCAEEIQDEAIKCRFCGEFLKKKSKWKGCLVGCLIAFVLVILLVILFMYLSLLLFKFILYKIFFAENHLPYFYYYSPFNAQGMEGMFREFGEAFREFWMRFRDFFHPGSQNCPQITF